MGYIALRTFFIKNDSEMCIDDVTSCLSDCKTLDEFLGSLSYNKDQKEMYIPAMDEVCTFDDMQIIERKPFTIIKLSNVRTINLWYYNHFDTVIMTSFYIGKR